MLSLMVLFFVRSIDCFHRDFRALNASRVVRIILCRTCVDPYYGPVSTRNFLNLRDLRALDSCSVCRGLRRDIQQLHWEKGSSIGYSGG